MQEFEAHFLEIDVDKIQHKLNELGAQKISDSILQEMIFDKPDRSWNKIHKRIRIRTNGSKSEVAYKEQGESNQLGNTLEIETQVADPVAMRLILERLDQVVVRRQEKRRITYKLGDVVYDLDFWPQIPPYLEIESDNQEKVQAAAKQLGLDWSTANFLNAKEIYEQIYNIKPLDKVTLLSFEKIEYESE